MKYEKSITNQAICCQFIEILLLISDELLLSQNINFYHFISKTIFKLLLLVPKENTLWAGVAARLS